MRVSSGDLASPTLQFDRDGHRLLTAQSGDGVTVTDLAVGARSRRLGVPDARAVAGFADQVWVAASDGQLRRFDHDGRELGAPLLLPARTLHWQPAPCGPPGVVWGAEAAVGIIDDLGQLALHAFAAGDLVVPLTARRAVVMGRGRGQLPSGVTLELAAGARPLGGAILADGRTAVLLTTHGAQRAIEVIALGTGHRLARREVPPGRMRLATRTPTLVIETAPRTLEVIDLRSGRVHGTLEFARDVDEIAIDPAGGRLAVQWGNEVELVGIAARLDAQRRSAPVVATGSAAADAPADGGAQVARPAEVPAEADAHAPVPIDGENAAWPRGPLYGLAPRRDGEPMAAVDAHARLAGERELVLARCLLGIAQGWDSRRLGYANEGAHPFELEVAALGGGGAARAPTQVADARRRCAAAREARVAARARGGAAGPLDDLAAEFALGPLELDVLMLVAAPTLWGETARLYAVMANDRGRAIVDEVLVEQLLEADELDRHDVATVLAPDAPLRRHGLVIETSDRPRPFTGLAVDPVVIARLRAAPVPLPAALRVVDARLPLAAVRAPAAAVGALLRELLEPAPHPARVAVHGRRGSGRRTLLAALAAAAQRALAVIDLGPLPPSEHAARLPDLLRVASLSGLLPCVIGVEGARGGAEARDLEAVLAAHPGPVVAAVGADEPAPFPAGHLAVHLPPLSMTERLAHWRDALARHQLPTADAERLSSRYRLTVGLVERAVAIVASTAARAEASPGDVTTALERAICQGRDARLARLATRVTRLPRWSDIVLPPDVLDSVRELIGRVQHGRRVFEDWGFDDVMTTGRGLTALFDGRPGTGKTLVAGVIARELGLDLYRVDVSRLVSKWIGETEKHLAEIFDAVDDGQAIILFDEADSLFARRTEVRSSNDRYANLEVNYLLQRFDTFEGIAILTTNFGGAIDPAFRRRVSFRMTFPFPDEDARAQLWRAHLPARLPVDGELDLATLARRFQIAGGYIRNACLRAAFLAAQEETTLAQRHLERAVQLEYQQTGKLSTSGPVD